MKVLNQEIFSINKSIKPRFITVGNQNNRILIIDDFFQYPDSVRELALNTTYVDEKNLLKLGNVTDTTHWYTHYLECTTHHFSDFLICAKRQFFKDNRANNDFFPFHYTFQYYTQISKCIPHVDGTSYAGLVPLNTEEELKNKSSGTGFYRSKETGEEYTVSGTYRQTAVLSDKRFDDFEEYHVEYHKFNRLIMYEGNLLHTAVANWDNDSKDKRLTFNFFSW